MRTRNTCQLEPEPDLRAVESRRSETLRLLNSRVNNERDAWNHGRPAAMDTFVQAQRSAMAAAAAVESWSRADVDSPGDLPGDAEGESTPLVEAAGLPDGDPLRFKQHNRELRCVGRFF